MKHFKLFLATLITVSIAQARPCMRPCMDSRSQKQMDSRSRKQNAFTTWADERRELMTVELTHKNPTLETYSFQHETCYTPVENSNNGRITFLADSHRKNINQPAENIPQLWENKGTIANNDGTYTSTLEVDTYRCHRRGHGTQAPYAWWTECDNGRTYHFDNILKTVQYHLKNKRS